MFLKSVEILNRLVGEGNWITIAGMEYDSIVLQDGVSMPSREDFDRVKAEVELEASNQQYKDLRVKEYPSFADQFDLLYHGGYDAWKESIQKIKDKYPKPN